MTRRVISQLVNGFVAVMLLSACAAGDQDKQKPAVMVAKPVVKAEPPEEPVIPKLKPGTPKKAPASPRLTEPEATDAATGAAVPNGQQGPLVEAVEKDAGDTVGSPLGAPVGTPPSVDGMPAAGVAALPAPAVVPAEPEPVLTIA